MKKFSVATKLIVVGSLIVLMSTGIVGLLSILQSSKALRQENYEKVEALSGLKKHEIEEFYLSLLNSVKSLTNTMDIGLLYNDLKQYHDDMHTGEQDNFDISTPEYNQIHERFTRHMSNIVESNQYYDLFVICAAHGHVMYTYAKESDLGENLAYGQLKNSHLAEAWKGAIDNNDAYITDLKPYAPSNGAPAQFLSYPINDEKGTTLAVLVIQIPDPLINNIMTNRLGLGETGESYLVGKDHLMRSDSRFHEKAVLNTEVHSQTMQKALLGEKGIETVKDYRGEKVISAYDKIDVKGLDWIMLTEIDQAEVLAATVVLRRYIIVTSVVILILSILFIGFGSRMISKPVKDAARFAEAIASGDLTASIDFDQDDEIGQMVKALTAMSVKLKEIISSVITGSDNIASASHQLSGASLQMSQGASEQASSVEEVSSTMEEMVSNIQQNTENATQTEKTAVVAKTGIDEVELIYKEAIEANMAISEKINIINDIASRTNILALNAAVEAASSGHQGKGFAVVAAEVKKLAESSKQAAEEIVSLAQRSFEQAEKTGLKLQEIIPEVERTSQLVKEITAASTEQNHGANQVNSALQQLNTVTQQNASVSEELATSAEEMSSQAEQLKDIISFFKVDGEGNSISLISEKKSKKKIRAKSAKDKDIPEQELERLIEDFESN
nr:methyl-accepting chemotaxis protein [uncultured Carboxylicivirga sp.]